MLRDLLALARRWEPALVVRDCVELAGCVAAVAAILRAAQGAPLRVLAAVGPNVGPDPGTFVVRRASHARELRRCTAAITAGGFGTVTDALSNGLPLPGPEDAA